MIEQVGRDRGLQLKINLDAMALIGTDARTRIVKREALLVVMSDDFIQFGATDGEVIPLAGRQQPVDLYPAARFQFQAQALWIVAKMLAEVFAYLYHPSFFHEDCLPSGA